MSAVTVYDGNFSFQTTSSIKLRRWPMPWVKQMANHIAQRWMQMVRLWHIKQMVPHGEKKTRGVEEEVLVSIHSALYSLSHKWVWHFVFYNLAQIMYTVSSKTQFHWECENSNWQCEYVLALLFVRNVVLFWGLNKSDDNWHPHQRERG